MAILLFDKRKIQEVIFAVLCGYALTVMKVAINRFKIGKQSRVGEKWAK